MYLRGCKTMTFDEFINYRDVKIRNQDHKRIVNIFYHYLESVSGNKKLLPDLFSKILNIDLSSTTADNGCFNSISDKIEPPYKNVDFYIKFSNNICVYIYGSKPNTEIRTLKSNEYVLFVLSDKINSIKRNNNRHYYIT